MDITKPTPPPITTPDEALHWLREIAAGNTYGDQENAHIQADDILCDLLIAAGFDTIVSVYKSIPKWYA